MSENNGSVLGGIVAIGVIILIIIGIAWAIPQYKVYKSEKDGQAELAQANYNRQIAIVEAEAKELAATKLASAEVIRAGGVAKANEVIGKSLTANGGKEYLYYLMITEKMNTGVTKEVVYVPTEAQLPILYPEGK